MYGKVKGTQSGFTLLVFFFFFFSCMGNKNNFFESTFVQSVFKTLFACSGSSTKVMLVCSQTLQRKQIG